MLNLSHDAANQVVQRATALPLKSLDGVSRFGGYSQHYEDYSPAVDHLSGMRVAMHEMLLGRLDDVQQTITLFPGWPVETPPSQPRICSRTMMGVLRPPPPAPHPPAIFYLC